MKRKRNPEGWEQGDPDWWKSAQQKKPSQRGEPSQQGRQGYPLWFGGEEIDLSDELQSVGPWQEAPIQYVRKAMKARRQSKAFDLDWGALSLEARVDESMSIKVVVDDV